MKSFIRIFSKILNKAYLFMAIMLITFAVLVTLARALTPILKHYNHYFTDWAESYLHKPVKIETVSVSWRGFEPVLDLHNISVLDKKSKEIIFKIKDFQASLNIVKSLTAHKIIISRLYLNGMHASIFQNKNKTWVLHGFTMGSSSMSKDTRKSIKKILSWVLMQPHLVLQNINLLIKPQNDRTQNINNLDITLSNLDNKHYLRGQAQLSKKDNTPIDIVIDLTGDANNIDDLNGNFYLQGKHFALKNWTTGKSLYGFSFKQGYLDFKLWGKWKNKQFNDIQTEFKFDNINLQPINIKKKKNTTVASDFILNHFSANLFWQRLPDHGWQLSGDKINLVINQHQWMNTQFALWIIHPEGEQAKQFLKINYLQLEGLYPLLSHLTLLPERFRDDWLATKPSGKIENLSFAHHGDLKELGHYYLGLKFLNLNFNEFKNMPGFKNISGKLELNQKAGQLEIIGKNSSLSYGYLFSQVFNLNKLSTLIQWHKQNKEYSMQIRHLQLITPDMNLQGNIHLLLRPKKAPWISALLKFKNSDPHHIINYFPVKIMHKKLITWFKQALVSGKSASGSAVLFGALNNFPFMNNNGQFMVDSKLDQLDFSYAPKWPEIKKLSGDLLFNKHSMKFNSTGGTIVGQPIKQLSATIMNLAQHPQAYLHINSHVYFNQINQGKQFTLQSPLRNTVGKILASLKMQGTGNLHLMLDIPLGHGKTTVNGKLQINNNTLSMPEWRLQFNKLNGMLYFTDNSFSSSKLNAKLFGQPAKIKIKTLNKNKQRHTVFNINSKISMPELKKYLNLKRLNFINGLTAYKANVDIDKNVTHLTVNSQLKGVKIDLPEPYSKTTSQSHWLQVDSYIKKDHSSITRIAYHSLLGIILAYKKQNNNIVFSRAKIHFGSGGYHLQSQPGIFISGRLDDFIWKKWAPLLQPYITVNETVSHKKNQSSNTELKQIDLKIKRLQGFRQRLANVQLFVERKLHSWWFSINSKNIDGQLNLPFNYKTNTITGDFKRLYLRSLANHKTNNINDWDPRNVLPMKLSANDFLYAGRHYGKINVDIAPLPNGAQINNVKIVNKTYTLDTHGRWLCVNEHNESSFSGYISTDNLGYVLRQENFTNHIVNGKGRADFNLSWPSAPSDFQRKDLQGSISAKFTNGRITGFDKETNEKLGLGKLINVFSLQSLAKRLTLNFNDLGKKGYGFSEMRGDLKLNNGNVSTNDVYINGPVAEIYITGNLNLLKQLYNLNVKVNPYFTSSLPILATIAGGPVAGAVTWAASKVVRLGVEKVIIYQYHIGGSWKDPVVKNLTK